MAYKSRYEDQLTSALDRLTNREKFNYDFNADPMYQMYKDQYTKLGNEAAMNAAADVSALTGGYGNSYAATAAAQAGQQYLTKLNERIPELYSAAMNKYLMEGDQLKDTYSTLADADNRDYGKYRDDVADNQWQQSFDYGKERDAVADKQWQQSFDYGKERDAVADEQWQKNFDYGKQRDAVADEQWNKNYEQSLRQLEESIRQYNQNFEYGKARDAIADDQWRASFDENNRRYNQEWTASQEAQAAALALAQQRMANAGSGGGKKSDEPKGISTETMNDIKKTAYTAHLNSMDKASGDRSFGNYLDTLVKGKKITQDEADEIMKAYANNEI